MAKFIEVKYGKSVMLVSIDSIAYIKPSGNGATVIKLNYTTSPKGEQTIFCDDDYETFIARLQEITDVQREG